MPEKSRFVISWILSRERAVFCSFCRSIGREVSPKHFGGKAHEGFQKAILFLTVMTLVTLVIKDASQGELRSHGFFYKPDGPDSGTLGLPISVPGRPGYQHLFTDSASILFLRNQSLDLHELGELDSHPERAENDNCRASCVDWYGNARPLFVRGRVFALLGYELVEGRLDDGRIREVRRISYAPRRLSVTRREE
jgi:hypothetical protein